MKQSVDLTVGNVLSMPYKDNTFDVVFASFIVDLQKLDNIQPLLHELKRVIKDGGRVVIVAMTKEGEGISKMARCFYDWLYPNWPTIFGYRVSSRPIYAREEVTKAGFTIKKETLSHIPLFHFPIAIIVGIK